MARNHARTIPQIAGKTEYFKGYESTTITTMGAEPMSREQAISISLHTLHSMLLCCCWPVHKCVTVLSCFDTLIVAIFTYKSLNLLAHTIDDP
ncbi:hypothetical protein COOONC_05901 [Cooperia oncophora]